MIITKQIEKYSNLSIEFEGFKDTFLPKLLAKSTANDAERVVFPTPPFIEISPIDFPISH